MFVIIWGQRWRTRTLETFRSKCLRCRSDGDFTRFLATEYRHLFWIPLGDTGVTQHRLVCGHCGDERHVRDLTELDSPMLAELYGRTLRAGISSLTLKPNDHVRLQAALDSLHAFFETLSYRELSDMVGTSTPEQVTPLLVELRESAHSSIGRRWLETLQYISSVGPHEPTDQSLLDTYGAALLLPPAQIAQVLGNEVPHESETV